MNDVVKFSNVTKKYQDQKAVNEVSFSIQSGEIVAILGPNGAGKSTAIMLMLGLLEPSLGIVQLFSHSPKEKLVRERIGAMLQEVSVIDRLKVKEILELFRSYYSNPLSLSELVKLSGMSTELLNQRAEKLSGGQKRMLNFALSLAGNPDLLFFDEPTVGMDIQARTNFWNTIHTLKEKGKTIIFTTHYLQEADDVAERILLLHGGKLIADGHPSEIKRKITKQSVSFHSSTAFSLDQFRSLPHVEEAYVEEDRIYLITNDTDAVLFSLIKSNSNAKISGIQIKQGRLEEAFEQLTLNKEAQ